MLKQRSRELQESVRLREQVEQKMSNAQEAAFKELEHMREEAGQEREQLQAIVLELNEKV